MRPRTSYVRKTRPASVHVTGVSTDQHVGSHDNSLVGKDISGLSSRRSETPSSVKSAVSRKASNELRRPANSSSQVASGKSSGKTSPSPMSQSVVETSTIKRQVKKKVSPSVSSSGKELGKGKVKTPEPVVVEKVVEEVVKPEIIEPQKDKVIENFESIESAFGSGADDISYSSKTPDLFGRAMSADSNVTSEVLDKSGRDSASTNATLDESGGQEWSNPFITNVTPEPTANVHQEEVVKQASPVPPEKEEGGDDADGKPKIMTEEQAKAALAEKRRLAREAVEKEAARVAEVSEREQLIGWLLKLVLITCYFCSWNALNWNARD